MKFRRESIGKWLLPALLLLAMPDTWARNGQIRGESRPEGRYLRVSDLEKSLKTEFFEVDNRLLLKSTRHWIELPPEGQRIKVDNALIWLNYPVRLDRDGNWLLHRQDVNRTLAPFCGDTAPPFTHAPKILIDPGHGGTDSGAVSGGAVEKTLNLQIATEVARLLASENVDVVLTRSDDRALSLDERADRLTRENADLFLSIHQNSAASSAASGVEVFAMTPAGVPSSGASKAVTNQPDFGNRFDRDSLLLAHLVRQGVVGLTGSGDRGVKRARFRVLRKTDAPAVLVECGFISNPADRKRLSEENYRQTIARGIADGIREYIRLRGRTQQEK